MPANDDLDNGVGELATREAVADEGDCEELAHYHAVSELQRDPESRNQEWKGIKPEPCQSPQQRPEYRRDRAHPTLTWTVTTADVAHSCRRLTDGGSLFQYAGRGISHIKATKT